jgi:transposase-like protein
MTKYSREEKAKYLEDWKQSGKSLWVYAKESGINPQTFNTWTKKSERRFLEVQKKSDDLKDSLDFYHRR